MKRSNFLKLIAFTPMMGSIMSEIIASPLTVSPEKIPVFSGTTYEQIMQFFAHVTKNGTKKYKFLVYQAEENNKHVRYWAAYLEMRDGVYGFSSMFGITDNLEREIFFPYAGKYQSVIHPFILRAPWEQGLECLPCPYSKTEYWSRNKEFSEWLHLPHEQKLLDNRFKLIEDEYTNSRS